jgi:uncharacterized membrane protein YhaH (DUF805 family)
MADVFISYAREDRSRADHIARGLSAAGLDCFWDNEIPPGQTWADYIEAKLAACKAVVVLWSATSIKSQWVREEARMGRERAKLIPVLVDGVAAPFGFGEVQAADLSGWDGDFNDPAWRRVSQAVFAAARGGAAPQPAAPQPQQPAQVNWTASSPQAAAAIASAQPSPIDYIRKCLRLYADGKGRARRSEFGWFALFFFVAVFAAAVIDTLAFGIDPYTQMANQYAFTALAILALITPAVAAASRRAHDFGQSGWLAALAVLMVIPALGIIAAIAFSLIPGRPGPNAHGPDPHLAAV